MAAASSSAPGTSLRAVASNPTGGGLRGAVARADGAAPVNPPRRRRSFASRCFASSRRRPPSQTGGDPAAPIGLPRSASTAARAAAVACALGRAAGRRRARLRSALGSAPFASASVASAGSAWPGARGARALARASRAHAARGHQLRPDRPDCVGAEDLRGQRPRDAREQRGSLRVARSQPAPVAALLEHPRRIASGRCRGLRVVADAPPCAYASRPRLRCAAPTPRAARLASLALRRA